MKMEMIKKHKMSIVLIIVSLFMLFSSFAVIRRGTELRRRTVQARQRLPLVIVAVNTRGDEWINLNTAQIESSNEQFSDPAVNAIDDNWRTEWLEPRQRVNSIKITLGEVRQIGKVEIKGASWVKLIRSKLIFEKDGVTVREVYLGEPVHFSNSPDFIEVYITPVVDADAVTYEILDAEANDSGMVGLEDIWLFSPSFYNELFPEIEVYCRLVANTGYIVILHPCSNWQTWYADSLLTYLGRMYEDPYSNIKPIDKIFYPDWISQENLQIYLDGSIFIGNLPSCWPIYENENILNDLPYMTLWEESDRLSDSDWPDAKIKFWVSRIPGIDAVAVKKYLTRNILFRTAINEGHFSRGRALLYYPYEEPFGLSKLYKLSKIDSIRYSTYNMRPSIARDFLRRISSGAPVGSPNYIESTEYHWLELIADSKNRMAIRFRDGTTVRINDIKRQLWKPRFAFLKVPYICGYMATPPSLGVELIFENFNNRGILAIVGITHADNSISDSCNELFYDELGRSSIGHSFAALYQKTLETEQKVLGLTLIGDGTFRMEDILADEVMISRR